MVDRDNQWTDAFRVGVTGHRRLQRPEYIEQRCREVLLETQRRQPHVIACSALATGADTIFAEAAIEMGLPLEAIIPFESYEEDFETREEIARFRQLLAQANGIVRLDYRARSVPAYRDAGMWLVEHCQVLVAIWDGEPATSGGGTAETVEAARRRGMGVVHIEAERCRGDE